MCVFVVVSVCERQILCYEACAKCLIKRMEPKVKGVVAFFVV